MVIEKPWLSLLIPVYNVASYLEECVGSIVDQCRDQHVEIVLLDDYSTDDSWAICERLRMRHGPIIQLHRHAQNRGVSAARNSLVDCARGDYIWFVDSDDIMLPNAVIGLKKIVNDHQPDIVNCDYKKLQKASMSTFYGKKRTTITDRTEIILGIFRSQRMYLWSSIFRRELFDHGLRFPINQCFEDLSLVPRLMIRAKSFYYNPQPWIFYRATPGSIMDSVVRRKNIFDYKKHDDMSVALAGFNADFNAMIPAPDGQTLFWISHLMASHFHTLATRLKKAGLDDKAKAALVHYHDVMQQSAPLSFAEMQRQYLRRGKLHHWYQLRRYRALKQKVELGFV
jgi:glycosyltransferase involved in cell wall biosynthesis